MEGCKWQKRCSSAGAPDVATVSLQVLKLDLFQATLMAVAVPGFGSIATSSLCVI